MDPASSREFEQQLAQLRARIYQLEITLARHGFTIDSPPVGQSSAAVKAIAGLQPVQQRADQPSEAPFTTHLSPQQAVGPIEKPRKDEPAGASSGPVDSHVPQRQDTHSLESRIASQWFNRIGIAAVLIGMAWFLKFAIDNHWIGPLGRVLIGLTAGAGLVAWSEQF